MPRFTTLGFSMSSDAMPWLNVLTLIPLAPTAETHGFSVYPLVSF